MGKEREGDRVVVGVGRGEEGGVNGGRVYGGRGIMEREVVD